jgi:hypothetical protein
MRARRRRCNRASVQMLDPSTLKVPGSGTGVVRRAEDFLDYPWLDAAGEQHRLLGCGNTARFRPGLRQPLCLGLFMPAAYPTRWLARTPFP